MNGRSTLPAAVLGISLGLGIMLAGFAVGHALLRARSAERYVTVKGLSERELPANLVLWPIAFNVTAEDLATLQQRVDAAAAKVVTFLQGDFDRAEYSLSAPRVEDRAAMRRDMGGVAMERYAADAVVTVRTKKIDAARAAMQRAWELVKQGVALTRNYEYQTQYLFTDLESIKPEMIAEATRDARRAAEQFAQDSGSRVGGIRNAQQGFFSIEDRDPFSPEFKKVRVVTTVQYFLED